MRSQEHQVPENGKNKTAACLQHRLEVKVLTIPNYPEDKYMYGDKLNVTNNKKWLPTDTLYYNFVNSHQIIQLVINK